jgi:hypothetical protein
MRELICGLIIGLAVGAPCGAWWTLWTLHNFRRRWRSRRVPAREIV